MAVARITTEFLEFFRGIGGFAVDVDMRAKFLGESGLLGTAADGDNFVSKLIGKLNSEMPEAADALDGNEV